LAKKIDVIAEIKKGMKGKKLVIGVNRTIKNLKLGKLEKVLISSNCPAQIKLDVKTYGKLADCSVQELSISNEELGIICKKQFSVSVLGIPK
jgi:ribosomal protein L30E